MIKINFPEKTWPEIEKLHKTWFINYLKKKQIPLADNLKNEKKDVLSFIKETLGWSEAQLEEIVLAKPNQLKEYTNKDNQIYKDYTSVIKKGKKYKIKKRTWKKAIKWSVEKILQYYFGYDDFESGCFPFDFENKKNVKWGAYEFFRKINIDVCPYCNRQYVFTIKDGDGRPQIDHFFPQSDFPYLSCSLYNFIPSCSQCNHQKGDILNKYASSKDKIKHKEFKYNSENRAFILYPYEESFDVQDSDGNIRKLAWFRALYDKQKDNSLSINDSICVKVKKALSALDDKIDNSTEAFHLNELYSCNKIELNDLFNRYRNYCKPKIDEITKLVLRAQLGDDCDEKIILTIAKTYSQRMKNMILGIPLGAKDKQYPLRKFKEDIIEQLDKTYKNMKKQT